MDRSTKGHYEVCYVSTYVVGFGLFQSHGNRRRRRLGANGSGVSRKHVFEQFQRVLFRQGACKGILQQKHHAVQRNNHYKYLCKYAHNFINFTCKSHVGKDAEHMKWEKRNNNTTDEFRDNVLKIFKTFFQSVAFDGCNAKAHNERKDKGRHNAHNRRHLYIKERTYQCLFRIACAEVHNRSAAFEQTGEKSTVHKISKTARTYGRHISDAGGKCKCFTGAAAQIANAGHNKANNNKGNREVKEIAKQTVKGGKYANGLSR